jgi:hypothetical protein
MDSFAVFLCDYINMSLVVTQAMKKLFQFCSREYKCAFLEVASFGMVLPTLLVRFLVLQMRSCIDPAIQAGRRGLSPHRWCLEPSVLFGYRVEHELAQDKEHSFPCRTVAIYFLQRP